MGEEMDKLAHRDYMQKCMGNPDFVAYWVNLWCIANGRTFRDVLREWDCDREKAVSLMLFPAPRTQCHFRDMMEICAKHDINPAQLARLVYLCRPRYAKIETTGNVQD